MSTLEKAISIAALAHEGQRDKAGKTYILHLLRVMLSVPDGHAKIVAVLHDILEDTHVTAERLSAEGFSSASAWINVLINANPDKRIIPILGGDAFNRALERGYTPWNNNLPYCMAVVPRPGYETTPCTRESVFVLPPST